MKTVLQFSGGKDSLACLYLLRDQWADITVAWVNTGASYPETIEQMEYIRALVPNFVEVKSNQPENTYINGIPSDVVPSMSTLIGMACSGNPVLPIQSWHDCCLANIWRPMSDAMLKLGATRIIRGQRADEIMKGPIRSGTVENGVEYIFPLEQWTEEDVKMYLEHIGVDLPSYYQWSDTSLDCYNCTAFLAERKKELSNLKNVHPEIWSEVKSRLDYINYRVFIEYRDIHNLAGSAHE